MSEQKKCPECGREEIGDLPISSEFFRGPQSPQSPQTLYSKASIWVGNHLVIIVFIFMLLGIYIALNPQASPWK
jgi:hypothetical protein